MKHSGNPPATRLLSCVTKLILLLLSRHASALERADLATVLTNSTERILNLPGKLSFFPTKTMDVDAVRDLISALHPLTCNRELIRLGPNGDGGYLVPNDLEGIEACFSPGVGDVAGFELDCAKRGLNVFLADGSVESPPTTHERFTFCKKYIGATTESDFLSLEDWVARSTGGSHGDLILQMDIEGHEYETLLAAPRSLLKRFRIMVVEFHGLENLFSEPIFA